VTTPTALVTGGATGIGRATVYELARRGYTVGVGHLQQAAEADLVAEKVGGRAFEADVADPAAVSRMVTQVERLLGPVEVAVCCAGVLEPMSLEATSDASWARSLRIILGGTVNVIAAVSPCMKQRRSGSIVTISSELALIGQQGPVSYVTAKAAIFGLTRAMAHELAPSGIRVNCVAPGPTDTTMLHQEWRNQDYLDTIPLGRFGAPEEIAASIVGLAEATWTTGQVLSPNGGVVIQ
jgi:2-hydroxycyclohexanecarboxyl-CoA dehydrogenase